MTVLEDSSRMFFQAAVRALDSGEQLPCLTWQGNSNPWLSELEYERDFAAHLCQRCQVLAECTDLTAETKANFGVWGGVAYFTKAKPKTKEVG